MNKANNWIMGLILATVWSIFQSPALGLDLPKTPPPSSASESGLRTVASGEGATREIALVSALRHALEQTLGARLESKTLIQNLKRLDDRVYSKVSGYIKTYSVVDELRVPSGDYRVVVEAEILQDQLDQTVEQITGSRLLFDGKALLANFQVSQSKQAGLEEYMWDCLYTLNQCAVSYTFKLLPGDDPKQIAVKFDDVEFKLDRNWKSHFLRKRPGIKAEPEFKAAYDAVYCTITGYTSIHVDFEDSDGNVLATCLLVGQCTSYWLRTIHETFWNGSLAEDVVLSLGFTHQARLSKELFDRTTKIRFVTGRHK